MSAGDTGETVITSAQIAGMAASNESPDPRVYELEGPAQPYFELPLDWHVNIDGELAPDHTPGAVRMVQRVHYVSFRMLGPDAESVRSAALEVMETVRRELRRQNEISFIWWRLYPKYETEQLTEADQRKGKAARHKVRLRLGTLPTLPTRFWLDLSRAVTNISEEPLVPRER